jgi:hypothetical protein
MPRKKRRKTMKRLMLRLRLKATRRMPRVMKTLPMSLLQLRRVSRQLLRLLLLRLRNPRRSQPVVTSNIALRVLSYCIAIRSFNSGFINSLNTSVDDAL